MPESKYKCYYLACFKFFHNKYNLRRHINSFNLKLKTYKCPMCAKMVVSKQSLQEHTNIHTGDKPYICTYSKCRKTFRQSSRLSLHKLSHYNFRMKKEKSCSELLILSLDEKGVTRHDSFPIDKREERIQLPKIESISAEEQVAIKLPVLSMLLNHIK